jgi:hypothetical protein
MVIGINFEFLYGEHKNTYWQQQKDRVQTDSWKCNNSIVYYHQQFSIEFECNSKILDDSKNKVGPRTLPRRTPLITGTKSDLQLFGNIKLLF